MLQSLLFEKAPSTHITSLFDAVISAINQHEINVQDPLKHETVQTLLEINPSEFFPGFLNYFEANPSFGNDLSIQTVFQSLIQRFVNLKELMDFKVEYFSFEGWKSAIKKYALIHAY